MSRAAALGVVLVVGVGLAACGRSPSPGARVVRDAQRGLAHVHAGDLSMRLTAAAGATDATNGTNGTGHDVGFALQGPFELRPPAGDMPVAKLQYTQLAGAQQRTSTFLSTGSRGFVEVDGRAYEVPPAQLAALRVAPSGSSSLGGLDLTHWARDPRLSGSGIVGGVAVDRVEADLDPVKALNDVFSMAGALGVPAGEQAAPAAGISGAAADQLRRAVRRASLSLSRGHDDHVLRSLHFDITFVPERVDAIRSSLGDLAGARMSFDLTLDHPNQTVTVDAPTAVHPLSELSARR